MNEMGTHTEMLMHVSGFLLLGGESGRRGSWGVAYLRVHVLFPRLSPAWNCYGNENL